MNKETFTQHLRDYISKSSGIAVNKKLVELDNNLIKRISANLEIYHRFGLRPIYEQTAVINMVGSPVGGRMSYPEYAAPINVVDAIKQEIDRSGKLIVEYFQQMSQIEDNFCSIGVEVLLDVKFDDDNTGLEELLTLILPSKQKITAQYKYKAGDVKFLEISRNRKEVVYSKKKTDMIMLPYKIADSMPKNIFT